MIEITGTERQKRYAQSIIRQFRKQYPDVTLPDVSSPQFWIDCQHCTIDELLEAAEDLPILTPFTATFPRYGHEDAIAAVKSLGNDYAVLDVETTGLKRNADEITEISVVHASGRVLIDTLVQPTNKAQLLKSIQKGISKITAEELSTAPSFEALAPQITAILNTYHIVIYNSQFDGPFLAYEYFKNALEVPTIRATCAMRIVSAYLNIDTNISLENACLLLGVEQEQPAHRARSDCLSTLQLLRAMRPKNEMVEQLRVVLERRRG